MPEKCTEECAAIIRLEHQFEDFREKNGVDHREIRDRLNRAETVDAVQDERYKDIDGKLDKLLAWQETQQSKPARRWDGLVEQAIWAVVAAVIALLLRRLGL